MLRSVLGACKAGIMRIAKGNRNISILWCVLILTLAWVAWCIFFLPAGVDVTDEGYYCSTAWRFSQGDLPYADSNATNGLSFWFTSWVFYIYPGCGLLGLRIVWAVFMLLYALAMAGILLRYFDPVLSFAASGVSLFFVTGGAIKVLCYNQVPVLGLLVAVWLWLAACESGGRKQVLLAAGAGISALLATLCRISLLPILLLPVLSIVYDSLCGFRPAGRMKAAIAFMAAYIIGLACFFLALYIFDLLNYFSSSLFTSTDRPGYTLNEMINHFLYSFLFLLIPAVLLSIVILLKNYQTVVAALQKNRKFSTGVSIIVAVLCFLALFPGREVIYQVLLYIRWYTYGLFTNPFSREMQEYSHILLALAFSIAFAVAVLHFVYAVSHRKNNKEHAVYRLSIAALFMSILMILGTGNYPAPFSVRAIAWLPISVAFCLSWTWVEWQTARMSNNGCRWLIKLPLILAALIYVFCGVVASCFPYRDNYIGNLNSQAASTRLQGIRTTAERAQILDSLVAAVERNSSSGDRILAYENLPMLYFLTNRLPSPNTTWVSDFLPVPVKQSILKDMVERNRLPTLIIRAQYSTREVLWPVSKNPLKWDYADPIDAYIREHYRIVEEIERFQIELPID